MRKYARLREPYKCNENEQICKIMLYETEEGICLFGYGSEDAVQCSSDLLYDSLDDLYEEWNDRIDETGWIEIEDPLPGCQHDAFIPLRVKGRDEGKPEWGKFETLEDGKWIDYKPEAVPVFTQNQFSRTQLLYGPEVMHRLASCRVAVFGIGGVGGYAVEALVRSGIGALDLIDDDRVCLTNLNRQIIATRKTVGRYKVDAAKERILEINPDCDVRTYKTFYLPETQDLLDFKNYDYIVDAIDTVTGKLTIIENAKKAGVPVISSMGAGNKTDPSAFEVADIYKTSICPLAKVMRRECRKRGIESLKVVYSREMPIRPLEDPSISCRQHCICPPGTARKCTERRDIPGSTAFVPSVVGLIIAGEIINDLAAEVKAGVRAHESL